MEEFSVREFRDGTLKLKGSTSGLATLKAPAVASTYVNTLPARTGILADDFDLALKASLGSPETFTALKKFIVAGFNSDVEFGDATSIYGDSTVPSYLFNAKLDAGTWKYMVNGYAVMIQADVNLGELYFYTAPSGTAGGTITWGSPKINLFNDGVVSFAKAVRGSQSALTSSSNSIAIDFKASNDFTHTFTEDTTLANPSNVVVGQSGSIFLTQHASSPKTLAFGSNWDFVGGTVPVVSATNSTRDRLDYTVRSATQIEVSLSKAWS